MKIKISLVALALAVFFVRQTAAQSPIYSTNNEVVQTFAGFGIPGYVDGQGQFTEFFNPTQIVSDTASNLYVWDSGNFRIRKITPNGTVSTFAGGGINFDGYGTNASLGWGSVGGMAIDHKNTLWLVMISQYGGYPYLLNVDTNTHVSIENGGLTNLNTASGLCFDSANNLYYSGGNRIYKYNPVSGNVQPFAGSGVAGNFDGQGIIFSAFSNPTALTCDQADNIYVWDLGNNLVRRVDQNQNVTTLTGSGYYSNADGNGTNAVFYGTTAMFSGNDGSIYVVGGSWIRKMSAQTNVVTLAGNFFQPGFANGSGEFARFNNASGGCFSQGMIFVADSLNHRIRNIAFNPQPQVVLPANLQLKTYPGLQITGIIGRTYQIQASTNLNAWEPVTTLLLTSSPYLWVDQNPVNGSKYYRAVMLP